MNYFQVLVWPGGGLIGIVLWILSVITISIIVEHFISIRRTNIMPPQVRQQVQGLFDSREYRQAIEFTDAEPSFLSCVVNAALSEAPHGYGAMERAMEEAAETRVTRLLRHIEWLNLIGNISPMLGLLGTVWGMIGAFFTIVQAGGIPDPANLAGDIGVALVTTLLGLGVAIPALAVYAIMRNRIDMLSSEAMITAQELITNLRPAPATSTAAAAQGQAESGA